MPSFTTWHVFPSELYIVSAFGGYLKKNEVSFSEWPLFIIYGFEHHVGW